MRALRQTLLVMLAFALVLGAVFGIYAMVRNRPQDLPWSALDLAQPIGAFTGRKLAGLGDDFPQCRALLTAAGVRYSILAPVPVQGQCGYADGIRLLPGGPRTIAFSPANLGTACPVAAALAVWEWQVLQPAAQKHFGAQVDAIEHFGSYSCRRIYGRGAGDWSEHATADAIDVAGFRLSNGQHVSVLKDWNEGGEKAAFLREIRNGGCKLFSTVLSPDYNAAHHDHLHLDEAARGEMGWRSCR